MKKWNIKQKLIDLLNIDLKTIKKCLQKGRRYSVKTLENKLKYLNLEFENHYDLGYEYAQKSQDLILKGIAGFENNLNKIMGLGLKEFSKLFLSGTTYIDDAKRFAPGSIEEIQGIADFLKLSLEEIFTYSAIDETPVFINNYLQDHKSETENCTSIGVVSQKNNFLAHNNDLPYSFKGTQMVLQVTDKNQGNEYLTATLAGLIAQSGINKYGLAVTVNTMSMLNLGKSGLIGTIVLNEILNKKDVNDALNWLNKVPIAGGVNYCIADKTRTISVETSHNNVSVIEKEDSQDFIAHTNHPLVSNDWDKNSPSYVIYEEEMLKFQDAPNKTHHRYKKSVQYLSDLTGDISFNDLINIITTIPIKNESDTRQFGTIISSIADINNLSLWVASDFPTIEDYIEFSLK